MNKKIFICAGDPSGDIHAARLMKKINENINVDFFGIGGNEMENQGLKSIVSIKDISVVGFWEVAKKYNYFKNLLKKCEEIMMENQVDLFLPVDYPGFNLRLSKFAKSNEIPVVYYIAPQLWAWGKNRAKNLVGKIDTLCTVFPFEEDYFKKFGINAEFVGHPLLEDSEFDISKTENHKNNLIAFMPGSREQEISRHIELYKHCIEILKNYDKDLIFGIAKSSNVSDEQFIRLNEDDKVEIYDNSKDLMREAYCGVVKTGTSNLEAALLNMPFVMIYKTSYLSYNIGKNLVNLPYISLVNILREKMVIKELIQKDANPRAISNEIIRLIENKKEYDDILNEFKKIREYLGEKNATENTLEIIKKYLD